MAETIARSLRDGCLEGEHAPALTIEDSHSSPLGSLVFDHFLSSLASNVSAATSQARGLVLVAFSRSPSYYLNLLKSNGLDASSVENLVCVLDCYSDPLGWKERLQGSHVVDRPTLKESVQVCREVRDTAKLLASILDLGKVFIGEGKARFAVAIDSVSTMLRYASLPSVVGLLSNLRSYDQTSCIFWLTHSDLHEPRAITALEYISTMVAYLEPKVQSADIQRKGPENLVWLEQHSRKAKFGVRMKRRNGRVKSIHEELLVEEGIKFAGVSAENTIINQDLLPKVQFNLKLSEKELEDRSKVVLPFEHQGNGKTIQIYDGRRSLSQGQDSRLTMSTSLLSDADPNCGKGEIHYIRDSDDEQPDSDEDPDDDLDI